MKYAARRTWPTKSNTWEHHGEGDNIGAFAVEFAAKRRLPVDSEFIVIEQAGPDSDIQFFKVTGLSPYQVTTAEPRIESAKPSSQATPTHYTRDWIGLSPFISTAINMTKVGVLAILTVGALIALVRWIKGG